MPNKRRLPEPEKQKPRPLDARVADIEARLVRQLADKYDYTSPETTAEILAHWLKAMQQLVTDYVPINQQSQVRAHLAQLARETLQQQGEEGFAVAAHHYLSDVDEDAR